jgi:hypothetical protein
MSSPRSTRVRTKVVALLVSLFALWAFAAFVTVREGMNLLWVSLLDKNLGRPAEVVLLELEHERRLSLAYLGDGGNERRTELLAQRAATDAARTRFEQLARGGSVGLAASDTLKQQIDVLMKRLDELGATRTAIDERSVAFSRGAEPFNAIIDAGFAIYGSLSSLDDPALAQEAKNLVTLVRAREILSREDALLSGALAAGRWTSAEQRQFVQLVGVRRYLRRGRARAAGRRRHDLPRTDRQRGLHPVPQSRRRRSR